MSQEQQRRCPVSVPIPSTPFPSLTVVLALLFLGVAVGRGSGQVGAGLENVFREAGFGYSIRYPADWTYVKPTPFTVVFSGREGTEAYFSTVSIQNLASTARGGRYRDLDDVVNHFKDQLRRGAQNLKMGSDSAYAYERPGLGLEGREFTAEYIRQGEAFRQWIVIVPRPGGEMFHAWSYTSPVGRYDAHIATAQAMLTSWVVLEAP